MPCMNFTSASGGSRGMMRTLAGVRIFASLPGAPGCTITCAKTVAATKKKMAKRETMRQYNLAIFRLSTGELDAPIGREHTVGMKKFVAVWLAPVLLGQVTALRVGHLVDPETGTASANQVILIENGRFSAVGNPAIPAGAQLIDLSQSYVLPGLVDAH